MYVVKRPYQNVMPYPYGRKPYVRGYVVGHAEPLLSAPTRWLRLIANDSIRLPLGRTPWRSVRPHDGADVGPFPREWERCPRCLPCSDLAGPVP